jgi:hypothetical protein
LFGQSGECDGGIRERDIEDFALAVTMEILGTIVDPDIVEAIGSEALEALFDRAPGAIGGIVTDDPVAQAMFEEAALFARSLLLVSISSR